MGPLSETRKRNKFLLTIMCVTTRYPIAFPLRNLSAKGVVERLVKVFTEYGIPSIVQSDQGTNFTSKIFADVMEKLGVVQHFASSYHPESQGALERFHQTFKTLLKLFCEENQTDWDQGIDLLLFAVRDAKNESTGYSPFQLLFGRDVRGPLKILKDTWLNDESNYVSHCDYLNQFTEKLRRIRSFANQNLVESQESMKQHYDLKSVRRSFQPGDQVLVFLPNERNSLKAKYAGPYNVLKRLSDLNYIISTPDRRKTSRLVHINLLKPYYSNSETLECSQNDKSNPKVVLTVNSELQHNIIDTSENSRFLTDIETKLSHLPDEYRTDIINLLNSFPEVCADQPGTCHLVKHEIKLEDGHHAIKQPPYRLPPAKRERMKAAVKYLLDLGLAEPSSSPWASPCLLVPKSDGTDRLCTDYRHLNKITVPDAFPLPRLDDMIDSVGHAIFVSKIDLLRGYYQIPLADHDKEKTAFVTPDGLYQYRYMPFGLCNAPASFQRMINLVIQDLPGVKAYLDDLLVTSKDWQSHKNTLHCLFRRLKDAGLVIRLPKCEFANATVEYLGHIIGQGKTAPRACKIEAITSYPVPKNQKVLRRFLGMAGF